MKRNSIVAYFIGAGMAGTILFIPYIVMTFWKIYIPNLREIYMPFFLLPLIWGFWNWLYIRLHPPVGIGAWGALLGFILGLSVFFLLYTQGQWFTAALIVPVFAAAFYYLIWLVLIAPLNLELNVYA